MAEQTQEVKNPVQQPTLRNLASKIRDAASLELMKPVKARMMKRIKELEEQSQATHTSVDIGDNREWITSPPKIFIKDLSHQIVNGVGVITYYKYATEEFKNEYGEKETRKRANITKRVSEATGREHVYDHQYIIDTLVKETIEYGKALKTEEVKYNG